MKTMKIWRLAFAMLAAFSLTSCSSDDDDKDITKEIIMNVSAEPGVMYDLFDSMGEHPFECMRVMTEDEPGRWQNLYFSDVKGFTYERGHEYELRVKRKGATPLLSALSASCSVAGMASLLPVTSRSAPLVGVKMDNTI